MPQPRPISPPLAGLFLFATVFAIPASASFHFVDVNEVFSNADGSVQYVELRARANNQTNLAPTRIEALNADGSTTTLFFDFSASFAWSAGDTLLVATPAFEAAAGFAPDFVAPSGSLVSLTDGRIEFDRDIQSVVDAVAYGSYTGDNGTYGSPAPALPSDGCTSLSRIAGQEANDDNAASFELVPGTPTRQDGTTTTLSCTSPASVPMLDPTGRALLVTALVGTGALLGAGGRGPRPARVAEAAD